MATVQTLEELVIRNPELRDGRPVIAGTGVTVRTVVGYYKLGMPPEAWHLSERAAGSATEPNPAAKRS